MEEKEKNVANTTTKKGIKKGDKKQTPIPYIYLIIALVLVIILRILLTFLPGHKIDIGVLRWELSYMANNAMSDFTTDVHFVYGPLYAYLLWTSAKLVQFFSLPVVAQDFLIKIWAVLFDILGAYFIYLIGKKYNKEKLGLIFGILYAFNPAIFFNSSVWGQFDGITATLLIGVVYFFNLKRVNIAVFVYMLAALTKPQSIALFPLVAILYFRDFPWKKFSEYFKTKNREIIKSALTETFKKLIMALLGCILIYTAFVLPFYKETPFYVLKDFEVCSTTGENLAVNKDVQVSATEQNRRYMPEFINDGKEETSWSSGHTTGQWAVIDLENSVEINNFNIIWGYEYAKEYEIKVSEDSKKWTSVYINPDGKGSTDRIGINPVKARYVRLELNKKPFPYGLVKLDNKSGFVGKAAYKIIDFYYWLVHHYQTCLDDYPYGTANGFNLWTILGKQCIVDTQPFILDVSIGTWGYIFLFAIVWLLAVILIRVRKNSVLALYYSGFFLTFGMFMFASRTHERYLLPAIIFATVCILWERLMWIPTIILSGACLANQWYVYAIQNKNSNAPWITQDDFTANLVAWISFTVMILSIGFLIWLLNKKNKQPSGKNAGNKIKQGSPKEKLIKNNKI